ncbi:hypothetical protein ACGFYY_35315 [Streptomyces sp. NPDC048331]|uniref:hypothetical protein n=1 Tax=Streptomyces sp. NPDC048331 TaxID=3365534 RepID=UPI003720ACBE
MANTQGFAVCDPGDIATGGAYTLTSQSLFVANMSLDGFSGWQVSVVNNSASQSTFRVRVVCLDVS